MWLVACSPSDKNLSLYVPPTCMTAGSTSLHPCSKDLWPKSSRRILWWIWPKIAPKRTPLPPNKRPGNTVSHKLKESIDQSRGSSPCRNPHLPRNVAVMSPECDSSYPCWHRRTKTCGCWHSILSNSPCKKTGPPGLLESQSRFVFICRESIQGGYADCFLCPNSSWKTTTKRWQPGGRPCGADGRCQLVRVPTVHLEKQNALPTKDPTWQWYKASLNQWCWQIDFTWISFLGNRGKI